MSDEIRTAVDLRASIVDQRGGIERFDGPQRRLLDALVFELAKKPNEIDVRTVTDLMAMLPRPVSVPEANRPDDTEQQIAPLRRLFRHLHDENARLSAENAQLRAQLGLPVSAAGSSAITPAEVVPPAEWRGETYAGVRPGPDDPKPGPVIDGKANAPAARAPRPQSWDDSDGGKAWAEWHAAGGHGGPGYDRWANRNE